VPRPQVPFEVDRAGAGETAAAADGAEEAMGVGVYVLEDTLTLCARKALTNPAYQKCLIFLLTNRQPDKWKHFRNANQTSEFEVRFPGPTPEQRAAADARRAKCLELARQAAQAAGLGTGMGGLARFLLLVRLGLPKPTAE